MQSSPRAARDSGAEAPDTAEARASASGERKGWLGGLFRHLGNKPGSQKKLTDANANALLAFPSETIPRTETPPAEPPKRPAPKAARPARPAIASSLTPRAIGIAAAIVAAIAVLAFVIVRYPVSQLFAREPRTGTLTINTQPNNSDVLVDGTRRGTTPITLTLPPGAHTVTVRNRGDERIVPLTISPGSEVSQYFEMKAPEPVAVVGRVSVVTDPPGARVAIDGKARGASPLTVTDLAPSDHKITVTSETGSAERTVTVTAGGTASVMFSLPKVSGPVGGWLAVTAPFELEVVEHDDVIGTGGTSRIMLAAGRHDITFVNRSLGYQDARKIDVTAGKTTSIRVDPPKVSVSVNARPWADVMLDGNAVGQTPLSNLLVTIGQHELVFRNPQFPERRQTIVVTSKGPNRVAADLTK